jgi:hypothetical protein
MKTALLALLVALLPKPLQELPNAFPRAGAKQLIDNERVTVWDVTWKKASRRQCIAILWTTWSWTWRMSVKVTAQNGRASVNSVKKGQVSFNSKGVEVQEGVSMRPPFRHRRIEGRQGRAARRTRAAIPMHSARRIEEGFRQSTDCRVGFLLTPGKRRRCISRQGRRCRVSTTENCRRRRARRQGHRQFLCLWSGEVQCQDRTHSELLSKGSQRVIAIELK